MITARQYIRLKELEGEIEFIKRFLDSREGKHIKSSFSLCDKYDHDDYQINYSKDEINKFAKNNKQIMDYIADYGFDLLQKKLEVLLGEYRDYVKP